MNATPTLVVGFDGTAICQSALEWALEYARTIGGRVVAVTVCPTSPVPHSSVPIPVTEDRPPHHEHDRRTELLDAAVAAAARSAPTVPVRGVVTTGLPGHALCATAEAQQAVLLVVGSHSRGPLLRALLGSVSTYCTSHSPCPVVVMPASLAVDTGAEAALVTAGDPRPGEPLPEPA